MADPVEVVTRPSRRDEFYGKTNTFLQFRALVSPVGGRGTQISYHCTPGQSYRLVQAYNYLSDKSRSLSR